MRAATLLLLALPAWGDAGSFQHLGTYIGLGGVLASAVGPGPTEGSQRFYLSYIYASHTLDLVAVDPETGQHQVFPNPVPGEYGAWGMTVGPDGKIYVGTLPRAHILRLDPRAGELVDLGRPAPTEQYIWALTVGADGRIYGATYPQARLVRYDPASGALEDLGRMDPIEQYARHVAASRDGFVYIGIGSAKANIAAYEIATGEHRELLRAEHQVVAIAQVYRGADGKVYGRAGAQNFRLEGWNAVPISAKEAPAAEPANRLADGRVIRVEKGAAIVTDPRTQSVTRHRYDYRGNELPIFRLAFGPDGRLYASGVLPAQFLRLQEDNSVEELGNLGGGEVYSFLAREDRLLMAAYSGLAPLMVFDPGETFATAGPARNPVLVNFPDQDSGWRPQAFIHGPDGRVYIGAVAGYGKLGGPLAVWDVEAGSVTSYHHLVTNQSVVSLAVAEGLIVGGTTTGGGGGSRPTEKEAKLFVWDPAAEEKVFETVPVAGATAITDLIHAPNGLVYGIAGRSLFAFDPVALEVKVTKPLPFTGALYNSVALGPDGRIWGLASAGVFVIDPATHEATLVARAPRAITAGFALSGNAIYYASGAALYRYVDHSLTLVALNRAATVRERSGTPARVRRAGTSALRWRAARASRPACARCSTAWRCSPYSGRTTRR
mgnify:CR=1 FL=1